MPQVGLLLSRPSVVLCDTELSGKGWRVDFDAELSRPMRQNVSLTGQEKEMSDLQGRVTFALREGLESQGKGVLAYWEGYDDDFDPCPPGWVATIWLTEADLHRLVQRASNDRTSATLNIDVAGMEYGWAPDGSQKKWDNLSNRRLEIEEYSLTLNGRGNTHAPPESLGDILTESPAHASVDLAGIRKTLNLILLALTFLIAMGIFGKWAA